MKKTYFAAAAVAAIAVLLAVLIAGCDGIGAPPEVGKVERHPDGLLISFRGSNGRALTKEIAAAGADYFEVLFDNGSRKVRTSWGNGATGRIIPGNANYDNSATGNIASVPGTDPDDIRGKAYIFAGRNGTLLGVGVLIAVNNNDGTVGDGTSDTVINMAKAQEVVFRAEYRCRRAEVSGQSS